ncbi:DUF362 domain-containing protein [Verrucomicrobiota bacterium]
MQVDRRDFLKAAAAAAAVSPWLARGAVSGAGQGPEVVVVHGKDVGKMVAAGMARVGGWKSLVKPGSKVTLKPNAAWVSRPEQGGNTDPGLVAECVSACKKAGASSVVVPEKTCSNYRKSFEMSGIEAAVTGAGGTMYSPEDGKHFRAVSIPRGKELKTADAVVDVLDTDCLINIPVAKSHSGATLTLSMKNWMGSVKDRGAWHRKGLHQCIADFSTLVKPSLVIVDATRIMLTKGPRGPGEMAYPGELIFGRDPVAVDAYAAGLFKKQPFDIGYIRIAHEMNVGCGDLEKISVIRLEA